MVIGLWTTYLPRHVCGFTRITGLFNLRGVVTGCNKPLVVHACFPDIVWFARVGVATTALYPHVTFGLQDLRHTVYSCQLESAPFEPRVTGFNGTHVVLLIVFRTEGSGVATDWSRCKNTTSVIGSHEFLNIYRDL